MRLTAKGDMLGWWNWQTRYVEVVVPDWACRFESCPEHHLFTDDAFSDSLTVVSGRRNPGGRVWTGGAM